MALLQFPWLAYMEQLSALLSEFGHAKALATGLSAYAAYRLIHALFLSPLRRIPGPLLARLTNKRAEAYGFNGRQAHKALEEYEKYGDIYIYQPNAISISNPADVRKVLSSHAFQKPSIYEAHDYLGYQTTLSARDPQFASMRRRQIGPYFTNTYLAKIESTILEHGIVSIKEKWDGLLAVSDSGEIEVNYHKAFLYATFDIIGRLAFGKEFHSLKNDDPKVANWLNATFMYLGMHVVFPLLRMLPFSLLLSPLKRQFDEFVDFGARSIAERQELLAELERGGEMDKRPADLLQGFIDAMDPESKVKMNQLEVRSETALVLGAGSETTSNTLTWTIHLLMLYPECYRRAVEEVRAAFDSDHLITYSEAKARLPYLEACIYESTRLCPVVAGQVPRTTPKEGVLLSGHFIPGGTEINLNFSGVNHNKKYWKDPYYYDPTRFLDNEEAKRNVFTFSYGVRVCPGRQLAWFEMLTILANLLKDYDIRLPADYTLHGPNVLDRDGYPSMMDSTLFLTKSPACPERDCRLVVSKQQ